MQVLLAGVLLPLRPLWEEPQRPRRRLMPAWRSKVNNIVFITRNVQVVVGLFVAYLLRKFEKAQYCLVPKSNFSHPISRYLFNLVHEMGVLTTNSGTG